MSDIVDSWTANVTGISWGAFPETFVQGFILVLVFALPCIWIGQMLYALKVGSSCE